MAISSVTKGNVITTAKINEIITAANGAGVSLSVSGTTLYLKNGAGTNLSNVSVVGRIDDALFALFSFILLRV